MWISRKRLMKGDRFILMPEKPTEHQSLYIVHDRVQVFNIYTLLSQRGDTEGGSRAHPQEIEDWLQYDTVGHHGAINLDTGIAHYRIGGKQLGSEQDPLTFPDKVFLISEL